MDDSKLAALFMPHLLEGAATIRSGKRLVHYTSAEAAYRIISGREIWLRNAVLMNDFSEMRHGLACLQSAWNSPSGIRLREWLDEKWPGFREEIESTFDSHADGLTTATFMLSLSEHDDDEDELGRLSMWRAYGGRAGVALVLNPTIFLSETDAINAFSAPVIYRDVASFTEWFGHWVEGLVAAEPQLLTVDRERLSGFFFYTFRTFVLCTKHPGFKEEKEWRVFHSPLIDGESPWLEYATEVIAGIPQQIVKVHLRDDPELEVVGVAPATLLNRTIIGPCEHPLPIRQALYVALEQAEVPEPGAKVWMSFIPLRQR